MHIQSKKARLLGLKLGLFDTQGMLSIKNVKIAPDVQYPFLYKHILMLDGTLIVIDRLLPPRVTPIADGGWTMITIPHGYCLPESIQDKDPRYGSWCYAGKRIRRYVNWGLHPRVRVSGEQTRDDARILVIHVIVDGRCLDHWYFGANVLVADDL